MKTTFLTEKGPKAVGPYSTAVTYNGVVYLSGMIPIVPATGKPAGPTIEDETRQVLLNLETVLGELNLTFADVLKTTVYLTDMGDFAAVNALYAEKFGPAFPSRTCVEVSKLPLGVHVEIEIIAAAK